MGGDPEADGADGARSGEGAAEELTAVYRLRDEAWRLLYVGLTSDAGRRWKLLARNGWWDEVAGTELTWFSSRDKAAAEEERAIATELPRYNLAGAPGTGLAYTGAGRPPAAVRRRNAIPLRTSTAERELLKRGAAAAGMTYGRWLREVALEAARDSVARQKRQAATDTQDGSQGA